MRTPDFLSSKEIVYCKTSKMRIKSDKVGSELFMFNSLDNSDF